jgi:hypothetical protein
VSALTPSRARPPRLLSFAGLGAFLVLTQAPRAHAGERCQPTDALGNALCEVGIPSGRLEPIASRQQMSQWCWAASISMIFRFHGHPVAQERIVEGIWGELVDLPALSGAMMSDSLARPWTDDRGRDFRARVRVYDLAEGRFEIDARTVIDELRAERPLLVGTSGHAMVVTALRFLRSPWGAEEVLAVTVRDPWPGRGRRELAWHEMQPTFLATVDIPRARVNEMPAGPSAPGP